ncbi:MAG: helix-turn-helix transcriptional regulator [Myxococcota bacterium]|nr:helix-turn-helix transcriptional regulator [Myxococcota bacterium]
MSYILHMIFGDFIRKRRLDLHDKDRRFSARQVAHRLGIEPSYLSKIERGLERPPSIAVIVKLAQELKTEPDLLLSLAGKIHPEVTSTIIARPVLMSRLIRACRTMPDASINALLGGDR